MNWKGKFARQKDDLLKDGSICQQNRDLFEEFFRFEEYKLKRVNHLPDLDDGCYKTLLTYTHRLRNVNLWFRNKPWTDLSAQDIKKVFDDLEDGKILNQMARPFKDKSSYYNKIMKSKPFRLAGKAELAKSVLEFSVPAEDKEVRFITDEIFRKLVSVVSNPVHIFLLWLAWDIGENINTLLQLTKRDFTRQQNSHDRQAEYLVNLPKSKLKRSRQTRSEQTLYPETLHFADIVLDQLEVDEEVFKFEYANAKKIIIRARARSGVICLPKDEPITWKDLRSGMACHLLRSGWSLVEVNARLGHTPNSKALNAYINYLALDRQRSKERLQDHSIGALRQTLEESRRRERLLDERLRRQEGENRVLTASILEMREELMQLRSKLEPLLGSIPNQP